MRAGASSPEELESLLEDAFVTGDRDALAELFLAGAVLVAGSGSPEARGAREIERRAAALCECGYSYLADPRRVLQSHDTTLVIADHAVNVMRRGGDRFWRYAISFLSPESTTQRS
jgi:hypothetical protein